MGNIVGGLIGGVGSLLGGQSAKSNDLTGYNYLNKNNQADVNAGNAANSNISALLTGGPNSAAANNAFGSYLNSTGYQFQKQQGTAAVTGSAASKGMLNSGGTAKALTQYGQGLAGNYFNDYVNQLGTVANRGVTAAGQVGQAGTAGGQAAGNAMSTGITNAAGSLAGLATMLI
jgi:hypothetical protein